MKNPALVRGGAEVDQVKFPDAKSTPEPATFQAVHLGVERIATTASGTVAPDGHGDLAAVLGVHDRHHELVDLVAWFPDRPCAWWVRHGDECPILGAEGLAQAAWHGEPVQLYSTPEDWLRARCCARDGDHRRQGGDLHHVICILRWGLELKPLFDGVSRVDCDSADLERRLLRGLRSWEPKTTTSSGGVRHAA